MELICQTLCALALFVCGALVRGGLPKKSERRMRGTEPELPAGSQTLEDDLTALLRYRPAGREEENDAL